MEIKETIGIDVSKLTIDVTIHSTQAYSKFENEPKEFKSMLKWVSKNTTFTSQQMLYVFEFTGIYSYKLGVFLNNEKLSFITVPGLEIKRSLGITRGKDDRVDSKVIARYAYRLRDEIQPTKLPSEKLRALKTLLSLRESKVKQRAGDKATLSEYKRVYKRKENKVVFEVLESSIKKMNQLILKLDKELLVIINSDSKLKEQFQLLKSIGGIGNQVALYTIVFTEAFTKFKTHRQYASYCGTAPFPNSSGTSLRGRTKVSNLANKKLKSLLDLGAKSAIQHNTELRLFYHNRVERGKNKMSTINVVRNKLIARMFAVIKRGTPYVETMKYAS